MLTYKNPQAALDWGLSDMMSFKANVTALTPTRRGGPKGIVTVVKTQDMHGSETITSNRFGGATSAVKAIEGVSASEVKAGLEDAADSPTIYGAVTSAMAHEEMLESSYLYPEQQIGIAAGFALFKKGIGFIRNLIKKKDVKKIVSARHRYPGALYTDIDPLNLATSAAKNFVTATAQNLMQNRTPGASGGTGTRILSAIKRAATATAQQAAKDFIGQLPSVFD
jgi:hypothetical protein